MSLKYSQDKILLLLWPITNTISLLKKLYLLHKNYILFSQLTDISPQIFPLICTPYWSEMGFSDR